MRRNLSRLLVVAMAAGTLGAIVAGPARSEATTRPCGYTETTEEPAAREVPMPQDRLPKPRHKPAVVELHTNHGKITLTLDRTGALCTVQNFLHLSRHKFYDVTNCHRLTAYPTLKVLQCGDPSGTGEGGPGYKFKDELPTTLPPVPDRPGRVFYPRGALAMANAGPDTNGSQFFMVYADSVLRPNYTVFGHVDEAGMAALDRIAAGGVAPTSGEPTPVDGAPALPSVIEKARIRVH